MNKVSFPDNFESTNMIELYLLYFWIVLTIKFKMTGQNGSQNYEKTENKMDQTEKSSVNYDQFRPLYGHRPWSQVKQIDGCSF